MMRLGISMSHLISAKTLQHHLATVDSMKFDRPGAESLFRFLMALGATKDIRLCHHNDGTITVIKDFQYPTSILNDDGEWIDGFATGQQYYKLEKFLKILIRFDRSAWKRMKNVENKVSQMHAGIKALTKQL
jgi:hypothetical protein